MKNDSKLKAPHWTDDDTEREERPRDTEEIVELRRGKKTQADIELPEGFRLVTPRPKQYWMGYTLVWGFCVAFRPVGKDGRELQGAEEFLHVARYFQTVSDEVQMRWALADFSRELEAEGLRPDQPKQQLRVRDHGVSTRAAAVSRGEDGDFEVCELGVRDVDVADLVIGARGVVESAKRFPNPNIYEQGLIDSVVQLGDVIERMAALLTTRNEG